LPKSQHGFENMRKITAKAVFDLLHSMHS